jgi:hypothetical protein
MVENAVFFDRLTTNQVLLNDSLQYRRIALTVPSAIRVDNGDRSAEANSQAVRFGAEDPSLTGQMELLQTAFQEVPSLERAILVTTLGLCLIAAEEDVSPCFLDMQLLRCSPLAR